MTYTLKCLLYFWCPFGRAGRKEFSYFYNVVLVCALSVWLLDTYLSHHNPALLETLRQQAEPVGICLCIVVALAMTTSLIRRGHDLGYGGFSSYIKFTPGLFHTSFRNRLFKEDGPATPNEFGPAPKENK